jgi:tRNA A-37 threonylcarbamoyl transferase component Bud32/CheY-like chemotaxis protein
MDPSRWDRLEGLMERAADLSPPERVAFVAQVSGEDSELGAELEALLAAAEGAANYVDRMRRELLGTDVTDLLRDTPRAAATPDPWIGRSVSHYEIVDRLGGGGMGVVYRARDVKLDRQVALKFIAPELRRDSRAQRRFLHEARAASALDHPNICTVHEIAETEDGRLYIVMAAYEGETLRARIDRGPLAAAEALHIGEQVARALAAAHGRGIVHRDVKPDNVFLTRDGVVKLLDFGLARTTDSWASGAGAVGGTVAYMSPEQARGTPATERSDVWALGVILFEMLAGSRPFNAPDVQGTLERILTAEPDVRAACPDLPSWIVDVVQRALAREPGSRFGNAGEMLDALRGAGAGPAHAAGASRRRRVRRASAVAAGLLLLAAVTAVWPRIRAVTDPVPAAGGDASPGVHVLWVDDDPANNRFIIEKFTERGVQVTTVLNTAEALARFDPAVHHFVISDMGRYEGPGGAYVARAGMQLLQALRARHPALELAFCTSARAVAEYRAEALAAGARDIVTECEVILGLLGVEARSPG